MKITESLNKSTPNGDYEIPEVRYGSYGEILVCQDKIDINDFPVLTVGIRSKWYCLYIIEPGTNKVFEFLPTDDVGFLDDTFNPIDLVKECDNMNIFIDEYSLDMIIGRWENNKLELLSGV